MVISPHGTVFADAFSINLHPGYTGGLREFGNFKNEFFYQPDLSTIDHMQRHLRRLIPFHLHSEENLDYGTAVPLHLLASRVTRIIPVHTSLLDAKEHFSFGDHLKNEIYETNRRIAVLASADFTNTPKDLASAHAKKAMKLDRHIISCIESRNATGLLSIPKEVIQAGKMCGFGPAVTLHGLLERVHTSPKVISYENPVGVGYIVASFPLES